MKITVEVTDFVNALHSYQVEAENVEEAKKLVFDYLKINDHFPYLFPDSEKDDLEFRAYVDVDIEYELYYSPYILTKEELEPVIFFRERGVL